MFVSHNMKFVFVTTFLQLNVTLVNSANIYYCPKNWCPSYQYVI